MHWRTRFKRWLDQWLARTPRSGPDDQPELDDPTRAVEALKSRPSSVWTPAPIDAETRPKAPPARRRAPRKPEAGSTGRHLRLALQGGGAHGAFTWGVLDRLQVKALIIVGGDGSMTTALQLPAASRTRALRLYVPSGRTEVSSCPVNVPALAPAVVS